MLINHVLYLAFTIAAPTSPVETVSAVISADQLLQAQRTMRAAIGDYEAEFMLDIVYMTDMAEANGKTVAVAKNKAEFLTKHIGRYVWRESGPRFYSRALKYEEGPDVYKLSHCFDGSRYQTSSNPELRSGNIKTLQSQEVASVRHGLRDRCPLSLAFLLEGKPPLGGERYVTVGAGYVPFKYETANQFEIVDGFKTLKMSAYMGHWHKLRSDSKDEEGFFRPEFLYSCWWLDQSIGWMPRRIERYVPDGKADVRIEISNYRQVEEAVWFPVEGVITKYTRAENGNFIPALRTKISVDEQTIKTKQHLKFELEWPVGARLRDEDTGEITFFGIPTSDSAK